MTTNLTALIMKPYVIQLVSNPVWGGGEQYVLDLSRKLIDAGYGVEVVARPAADVVTRFRQAGVPVRKLPLRGNIDFISSIALSRIIRKAPDGPVVIHAHNFKTAANAVAARRLSGRDGVRVVVTRHLVKPGKTDNYHTDLYGGIDRIVFVSALSRDRFLSSGPVVDRAKICVVHNGVEGIASEPILQNGSDTEPVIMWHGRINPEKGLDTLIEALGHLMSRPWQLKLAGTGQARDVSPLVRRIRELGMTDRVEWLGYINDIPSEIKERNVFVGVLPSRVPEAFGLALLDYMSCGVPVITTDNGAQSEIITDGVDGMLFAPDDSESMAKAIVRMLDDRAGRDRMAREALHTAATRFSYDRFFTAITQAYTFE